MSLNQLTEEIKSNIPFSNKKDVNNPISKLNILFGDKKGFIPIPKSSKEIRRTLNRVALLVHETILEKLAINYQDYGVFFCSQLAREIGSTEKAVSKAIKECEEKKAFLVQDYGSRGKVIFLIKDSNIALLEKIKSGNETVKLSSYLKTILKIGNREKVVTMSSHKERINPVNKTTFIKSLEHVTPSHEDGVEMVLKTTYNTTETIEKTTTSNKSLDPSLDLYIKDHSYIDNKKEKDLAEDVLVKTEVKTEPELVNVCMDFINKKEEEKEIKETNSSQNIKLKKIQKPIFSSEKKFYPISSIKTEKDAVIESDEAKELLLKLEKDFGFVNSEKVLKEFGEKVISNGIDAYYNYPHPEKIYNVGGWLRNWFNKNKHIDFDTKPEHKILNINQIKELKKEQKDKGIDYNSIYKTLDTDKEIYIPKAHGLETRVTAIAESLLMYFSDTNFEFEKKEKYFNKFSNLLSKEDMLQLLNNEFNTRYVSKEKKEKYNNAKVFLESM